MIFKLAVEGDIKRKISYCILPFKYNRIIYWFHKVTRTYKFVKKYNYIDAGGNHLHPISYYLEWELIETEV